MINEKIKLFNECDDVFLETYCPKKVWDIKRDAIIVIPGGGYSTVCETREGEPIALSFASKGINAFVLTYSVNRKRTFPRQLIEVSAAIKHIKDNHEKYNINPDRVFVTGFSAGGHLCTSIGTLWHLKEIYDAVPMEYGYNKPTGIIPVYPVVSALIDGAHLPSFYNLLGTDNPDKKDLEICSLETQVDEKSSPACIIHTSSDELVSVENALVLADAYRKAGRKFEMHIFYDSPHGMALGNDVTSLGIDLYDQPSLASWIDQSILWMKQI